MAKIAIAVSEKKNISQKKFICSIRLKRQKLHLSKKKHNHKI
jgi:hypothetical protein